MKSPSEILKCEICSSTKAVTKYEDDEVLCDLCLCKQARQHVKDSLNKRCPKKHWAFSFPEVAEKTKLDIKKICPTCELMVVKKQSDDTWLCSSCQTNYPAERFKNDEPKPSK